MAAPGIPPFIAELTGPLLLGHFFNWGLFGALAVQTYVYYLAFPNDRRWPKAIVLGVFVIEVLQTVLATRDAFRNFATGWGNIEDLEEVGWLWFSVPVLGAIISCTSQIFFAWRIWILSSKNLWLPGIIAFLSILQGVAGTWSGIYSHFIGNFANVPVHTRNTTIVWLGGTALCDVLIAGSMLYYLNISRTGFRQTNVLLSKIIRVIVETGLICATFAVLDLALFLAFQSNNYHLAPSIALSKLYSNSLLVVLNARVRMVGGRNTIAAGTDNTLSLVPLTFSSSGTFSNLNSTNDTAVNRGHVISVGVAKEVIDDSVELGHVGTFDKAGSLSDGYKNGLRI
ncbi:hypothetical protein EYR40_008191 [Pleurotus pulmonarius]|nr:hypothetical protein EYR38_007498 [Pleurotus pulmonarius]KAF4597726.1 hypothetical protein EYR40_008191 [Pleurotus pulmonarius]